MGLRINHGCGAFADSHFLHCTRVVSSGDKPGICRLSQSWTLPSPCRHPTSFPCSRHSVLPYPFSSLFFHHAPQSDHHSRNTCLVCLTLAAYIDYHIVDSDLISLLIHVIRCAKLTNAVVSANLRSRSENTQNACQQQSRAPWSTQVQGVICLLVPIAFRTTTHLVLGQCHPLQLCITVQHVILPHHDLRRTAIKSSDMDRR